MQAELRNQVYLACDDKAETRRELCEAALASKLYPTATMPKVVIIIIITRDL